MMIDSDEALEKIKNLKEKLKSTKPTTPAEAQDLCNYVYNVTTSLGHDCRGWIHFKNAEAMIASAEFMPNSFMHRLDLLVETLPEALLPRQ